MNKKEQAQLTTTFLNKTEKRTFKQSGNSWLNNENSDNKYKKPKSDIMSKRLDLLEQKIRDFQHDQQTKYKQLSNNLIKTHKQVENSVKDMEGLINMKLNEVISSQENNLLSIQDETKDRKKSDKKIMRIIEDKHADQKSRLQNESKVRIYELENFKKIIESDLPRIQDLLNQEIKQKYEFGENVQTKFFNDFMGFIKTLETQVKAREEHNQTIYDMLSDITERTSNEMEDLKKERKSGQDNLLELLENACQKLNSIIQFQKNNLFFFILKKFIFNNLIILNILIINLKNLLLHLNQNVTQLFHFFITQNMLILYNLNSN